MQAVSSLYLYAKSDGRAIEANGYNKLYGDFFLDSRAALRLNQHRHVGDHHKSEF